MKKIIIIIKNKINLFNFKSEEELNEYVSNKTTSQEKLSNNQIGKIIQWKKGRWLGGAKIIELNSEKETPYLVYFKPCFNEETMYEPFYGDNYFAGKIILDKKEIEEFKKEYSHQLNNIKNKSEIFFYNMNLTKEEFKQGFQIIQL